MTALRAWDESQHPRVPAGGPGGGEFTSGGGGGDGAGAGEHPGKGYSDNAWVDAHGVIHTNNVYDAQRALFEDRKVELTQIKQVSTLIKRLGETAAEMEEQGDKAPVFNLCNVSVEGTNLFCAESKGIPRVEMPVIPAKRTKDFVKHLEKLGYKTEKDTERADHLRATQDEIDGAKVAASMKRIRKEGFYKRLVVSRDDYILDGHHTWAGQLGIDAKDGTLKGDKHVKITRVDIPIIKLIEVADAWTKAQGIAKKPVGQKFWRIPFAQAAAIMTAEQYRKLCETVRKFVELNPELEPNLGDIVVTVRWDEDKHPREPAGTPEGGRFAGGGAAEGGGESETIKLDPAVVNVGGDQWNKDTARRLEREYQIAKPELEKLASDAVGEDVEAPEDGEDDAPYVPEEWDTLSADDQSTAETQYIDWALDEAIDSESNNFYEEYAPHEAREKIATEFNDGSEREWAEDALGDSDLSGELPFTEAQILAALTINFEGNPGGSLHDPEFDWNDEYLDELKAPSAEQLRLPGIEKEEGHKLLTDDMRSEIEKVLAKAFDRKGDKDAGSIDVPEWVTENAKEWLGESWGSMDDSDKFEWTKQHTSILEDYEKKLEEYAGSGGTIDKLPNKFDPLNETTGADYKRTQYLARFLSVARATEILNERKLLENYPKDAKGAAQIRNQVVKMDNHLWSAWKGSSSNDDGILLQVATADELGGRLRLTAAYSTPIDKAEVMKRADRDYIGGYDGVKAYIRAKWEVSQYLLDKAGIKTLNLYRGISYTGDKEKWNKMAHAGPCFVARHYDAARLVSGETKYGDKQNFRYMPTLPVERNGAASTTTDVKVANGWRSGMQAVTLRAQVPRTAVLSLPAYGINVHGEHEVVTAGTAWHGWDAWAGGAPPLESVPLQHAA